MSLRAMKVFAGFVVMMSAAGIAGTVGAVLPLFHGRRAHRA